MERVEHAESTIEVFENDIDLYLHQFIEQEQIEDMRRESQAVWNSCLRHIYKNVFRDKSKLKSHNNIYNVNNDIPSNYNAYNYEMILKILDIYIYDMCMKYDKEVSILGFSTLTGIDQENIYNWGNESNKLSTSSFQIYKKLNAMREESLSNKLATGKQNPVGVLAILNRHYQWNLPGVSRENAKQSLTAAELPKLGTIEPLQISEKPDS